MIVCGQNNRFVGKVTPTHERAQSGTAKSVRDTSENGGNAGALSAGDVSPVTASRIAGRA
jgi:hypothetical protein